MKRFALNKISIAKLANPQTIKGGVDTPIGTSALIGECLDPTNDGCVTDGCPTGGTMPCTSISIDGELTSNPVGPDTVSL